MTKNVRTIPATVNLFNNTPINGVKKRKVAAYARVSTDSEEQLTSYEAQVDYYTNHIKSRDDWEFVEVYTDEGISGTSTKHREGFKSMIDNAMAGNIDLIITKSVSRFARNTVDSLTTIRKLKEIGCECYFEKENIWTFDGKGELLLTIMSSLAQEESRSISENVKWGHRKRFADGKVSLAYSTFLGYKKGEDGNLEIDEDEAVVVRRIYREYLEGSTPLMIANGLMKDKIKSPMKKDTWNASTVRNILKNEKYKGDALLQKHYTVDFLTKKQKKNEGEVPQYYVENNHEAIINPETFEMVQLEFARRSRINGKYSGVDIITAKLVCGECGGSYGAKVWHSTDKYRKEIYQCNRKYNGDKKCSTPILVKADIENRFINVVNKLIQSKDEIIENLKMINKTICNTDELTKQKNELHQKLVEQVDKIQELIEVNARVVQNQEEYQKEYEKLVSDYELTKTEHKKLELEITTKLSKSETMKMFIKTIEKQEVLLTEFDPLMWGSLLDSVKVYAPDDVRFIFRDGTEVKG
ncbi:MAG: recombinase family protein [Bacteroidales bacterium]|nr:recombinase family protein [Bacteroidales bacterium]MDD3995778.1 recombinase family protein [Bacilli bacterium]